MNVFLFAVLCFSWGSTWVAIKVGVATVPPLFFAGTRFVAAGLLILGAIAVFRGKKELIVVKQDIWPLILMSSLVISICFAMIFWGEQFVSASVTAIVVQGMIPIFLPFFAFVLLKEELNFFRLVSIVLGVAGIACIFVPGTVGLDKTDGNFQFLGLVAIVIGTLAYCYGSVWGRPLLARNSAVSLAGWQNLLGGIIVLFGSLLVEVPFHGAKSFTAIFTAHAFFAWIWLVLIGSAVGFVLYIVLLKAWGPSKVSPYAFATPLVAIILDYVLFSQLIGTIEFIGLIIIFVALGFAFYRPHRKENSV